LAVVDWIESTLDTKLFQSWSTVLGRDYEFIMNAVPLHFFINNYISINHWYWV